MWIIQLKYLASSLPMTSCIKEKNSVSIRCYSHKGLLVLEVTFVLLKFQGKKVPFNLVLQNATETPGAHAY